MCVSALPPVACQVLLQLCYPVELVEEPLVYGRQLVDLINTHAAVEGLKSREGRQICMSHLPPSASLHRVQHSFKKTAHDCSILTNPSFKNITDTQSDHSEWRLFLSITPSRNSLQQEQHISLQILAWF